jgi:putative hydroxymethylpyrimidine transport system substrate-binding protein
MLAILSLALAACGGGSDGGSAAPDSSGGKKGGTTKITFIGDWLPWTATAPMWEAVNKGFYKEAGLDVSIKNPANPNDPVKLVSTGGAQFGISYVPGVIAAQEKGIPVQAVGATIRPLTNGLFTDPAKNIKSPCDLKGKRVGLPVKPDNLAIAKTILASCKLTEKDVKVVDPGFAVNKLIDTGQLDAGWGVEPYEGALFTLKHGKDPSWLLGRQWGVPDFYWMLIVGNPEWMKSHPEETKGFLDATKKGIDSFLANPDANVAQLAKMNPSVNAEAQKAMADASMSMWKDAYTEKNGLLSQDTAVWEKAAAWMKNTGLVKQTKPVSEYFTNEYLGTP